jgi:hypothetical protein
MNASGAVVMLAAFVIAGACIPAHAHGGHHGLVAKFAPAKGGDFTLRSAAGPVALAGLRGNVVTLDPERDSLRALAAHGSAFHPSILGLSGSKEGILAVAKSFGVLSKRSREWWWLRYRAQFQARRHRAGRAAG